MRILRPETRSKNHQYPIFNDELVARYAKTTLGMVSGVRLNPLNEAEEIGFVLVTEEAENFSKVDRMPINGKLPRFITPHYHFYYQNDVVEVYSARQLKYFETMNRKAIESGILVKLTDEFNIEDGTEMPFINAGELD